MKPTNTTESTRGCMGHRVVVVLGIALMTVVGAGQAVEEGLRKINLDALPPLTGGFLLWVVVSYIVVAGGFLWIGFVLGKGVPHCLTMVRLPEAKAEAEHAPAIDAAPTGAPTSPSSAQHG